MENDKIVSLADYIYRILPNSVNPIIDVNNEEIVIVVDSFEPISLINMVKMPSEDDNVLNFIFDGVKVKIIRSDTVEKFNIY